MRLVLGFLLSILLIYTITLSIFLPKAVARAREDAQIKSLEKKLAIQKKVYFASAVQVDEEKETKVIIPTNTPVPTRTPTPSPTPTPKPKQTSSGGGSTQTAASATVISVSNDEIISHIMNQINEYRKSQGLSSVSTDQATCDFAKKRAGELSSNFSHDGFKPYPYASFSKVTENIAMNSNYKNVVPGWIASAGHAENMRADTPYVCVARNGNYYAYEGWKP